MITHVEPDILECEVKWALRIITTNRANGGDGIPVELFQIRKDDAVKVLHSICQQIWKTQQWPQDWKRSVFISIPKKRKAMPKNVQTTAQLHSVQFSCSVVSDFLQPHGVQHTRLPCPSPTTRVSSTSCPLNADAIQPSHPLLSPSPLAFNLFQHQSLFK